MREVKQPSVMWIGAIASEMSISPKTIRYYEEIGVLPSPARSRSGYRLYGPRERERLAFVLHAKQFGFSLEEIRTIIDASASGDAPCAHVLDLIDRKIDTAETALRALAHHHRTLLELRGAARSILTERARLPVDQSHVCVCRIIEETRSAAPE